MKLKIITSFLILLVVLVIPQVSAQTEFISKVEQKPVQVSIDNKGNVVVVHQIKDSNESKELKFVDGTVSNLEFIDAFGAQQLVDVVEEADNIVISPHEDELFVKYDLNDALILKNNVWTLDYRYVETTIFTVPNEVELLFVNERLLFLDKKNSFRCHGCEMTLEYLIDGPRDIKYVNWENKKFAVEMITFADTKDFEFDQPSKQINFKVNDSNQFVTTVIPLELLWGPYAILLDDKKIFYDDDISNGTHVWINIKPNTSGEITIIGTTVVPEFPIIAPLAIGFLIIMMVPIIRKFSLH